jgi:DNA-binding Lrp family transcriptional regulator
MEKNGKRRQAEVEEVENINEPRRNRKPNEREQAILEYLRINPRATYAALQVATGLKSHEVEWALKAMSRKKWIEDGFRVSPTALGYPERYRVDIWVIPLKLREGLGGRSQDVDAQGQRLVVDSQKRLGRYIMESLAKDSAFRDRVLVEEMHILLGGMADMSATVRARDNDAMLEFVVSGLRICEGIQQTTTCLMQWSHPDIRL